jgi:hypothetical protein
MPDWYGAHGPVPEAREWLRALRAGDAAARVRLAGAGCHQGTRWPVSALVVAPLVESIDDPATPERPELLRLLHVTAIGARTDAELPFAAARVYAPAAGVTAGQSRAVLRWLFHDGPEPPEDVTEAVALRWEADAWTAAAAHTAACVRWLADPALAARAAALLPWFPTGPAERQALLATPAHPSANLALAHLPPDPAVDHALAQMLADDGAGLTAAIALAHRLGEELPDPALDVLIRAASAAELPPTPDGWDRSMRGFVANALRRTGLSR